MQATVICHTAGEGMPKGEGDKGKKILVWKVKVEVGVKETDEVKDLGRDV